MEAVDNDEATIKKIETRRLHSIDEYLGRGNGVVAILGPLGGDDNVAT